ncbi:MAG: hypothetical protein J5861_02425 [Desulfovibrio sp.]|nr:hypothetical protein [Desulfovibrio sp.]
MRLVSRHGRLRIQMRILYLGQDLVVLISGGEAHLGAAAMGIVGHSVTTGLLLVPGHREDVLAQETADRMSKVLGFNVIVAAGIHYDNITPEEIRQIQTMVHHLTERCLAALTGGKAC